MPFNPNFVPSGAANKRNEYFMKQNNVRINKRGRNKLEFFGGGTPGGGGGTGPISQTGGVVSKFNRDGVDYTQIAFYGPGTMKLSAPVPHMSYAVIGAGGSGGRTGGTSSRPGGGGAGALIMAQDVILPVGD